MGAWTIPSTGCPSSTSPIDTDQSGWPAAKARVPSMGSTIQTRRLPSRIGSSAVSSDSQAASGRQGRQVILQERVDRDVGLGDGRTAVLEPYARRRFPAGAEEGPGDIAGLAARRRGRHRMRSGPRDGALWGEDTGMSSRRWGVLRPNTTIRHAAGDHFDAEPDKVLLSIRRDSTAATNPLTQALKGLRTGRVRHFGPTQGDLVRRRPAPDKARRCTGTATPGIARLIRGAQDRRVAVVGPYGAGSPRALPCRRIRAGRAFTSCCVSGTRALMALGPYAECDVVAEWRRLGSEHRPSPDGADGQRVDPHARGQARRRQRRSGRTRIIARTPCERAARASWPAAGRAGCWRWRRSDSHALDGR